MKVRGFTWPQWWMFTLIWFAVCFTLFWFSEVYRDVDAVIYPCVFFLIFSMLLGPGTCAGCMPPPESEENAVIWQFRVLILYVAWWGLTALLARGCFRLGLLPR